MPTFVLSVTLTLVTGILTAVSEAEETCHTCFGVSRRQRVPGIPRPTPQPGLEKTDPRGDGGKLSPQDLQKGETQTHHSRGAGPQAHLRRMHGDGTGLRLAPPVFTAGLCNLHPLAPSASSVQLPSGAAGPPITPQRLL